MSDIFREVDEDVRRDRALQFFEKYQLAFIGIAILVILATAAWRGYDYWLTRQANSASARYEAALDLARSGKPAEAEAALDKVAETGPAGYRALARLRAAASLAKRDPAAGAKAYDAMVSDPSVDRLFQDVAQLRAAIALMDSADPKDIRGRLEPLAGPEAPFRHTARELLALTALKANENDQAGRWLDALMTDPQTPAKIRQRAQSMLEMVRGAKPATG